MQLTVELIISNTFSMKAIDEFANVKYKQTFGKRSLYKDVVVKISLDSTLLLEGL